MFLLLVIKYLHGEPEMTPSRIRHKSCYLWVMLFRIYSTKWKWKKVQIGSKITTKTDRNRIKWQIGNDNFLCFEVYHTCNKLLIILSSHSWLAFNTNSNQLGVFVCFISSTQYKKYICLFYFITLFHFSFIFLHVFNFF